MHVRPAHILATAILALAAAAGARSEVTYAYYADSANYGYKIIHMPDFDQRRLETEDVPGLPGNGSMYCAPTSSMNMCAYIADHGFPNVPPQDYNWLNPANYDVATGSLFIIGLLSSTSPTEGTGGQGWIDGLTSWVPLNVFTVTAYFQHDAWWPRRWDLAQAAYNGSLVSLCYGFYGIDGEQFGVPVVFREGGHCVTLTEMLSGSTPFPWMAVRDPADDPANTTQSDFMNRQFYTDPRSVYHNGGVRLVDNLVTSPGDGIRRLLDGYIHVRPKAGVTWHEPPQEFQWIQATELLGSITPIDPTIPSPPGEVTEWTVGPELNRIYALVDIGAGEQLLYCFPVDGGEPRFLDAYAFEPHDMVSSNRHALYIAQGFSLRMVDISGEVAEPLASLDLSGPATAMAFDDEGQRLHVYNAELFAIQTFDALLQEEMAFIPVPDGAEDPSTAAMTWDRTRNALWLVSDHEPVAWRIPVADGEAPQQFELPGASHVTSIDVDDQGHLFVGDDGILREYREVEGGGLIAHDGPLAGREVGSRTLVTRCRTNYDPEQHTIGWHNVLPGPDDFGLPIPDCDGDVDASGAVDFDDLLAVLAAWGPCPVDADCGADLDGDEEVAFNDLLILLANYGPC